MRRCKFITKQPEIQSRHGVSFFNIVSMSLLDFVLSGFSTLILVDFLGGIFPRKIKIGRGDTN